jgi:hypothetical protein
MKNTLILFVLLSLTVVNNGNGQNIRKKTEKNFRHLTAGDSVLTASKIYENNKDGALLSKHELYYGLQPAGTLTKEISARFDSSKMIIDEHIYTYKKDVTDHERLKTKYLHYAATESESKYIWRQYYDISEEMMREDTLTYDKKGNLTTRMVFDYRGNTSQGADVYIYDNKNRLKRWKWYSYWSTVNKKSKPVTRKEIKQDYKYKYNKAGNLLKVSGKRWSTALLETYKFDSNGKLLEYVQLKTKKSKNSKSERAKKGKFSISEEKLIKTYQNGFLTLEKQTSDDKEIYKTEICYHKDSLISSMIHYKRAEKNYETRFEYDQNNKPLKKITQNYLNNKPHSLLLSDYNMKGNIILEIKTLNGETMNRTEQSFDEKSNLKSIRSYMKTKNGLQLFESAEFEYEFF